MTTSQENLTKMRQPNRQRSVASSIASTSDRLRRMKLLERYLKQADAGMKLTVENLESSSFADPLRPKFLPDQDGLKKRRKKYGWCKSFSRYMSYLQKKFGLQHILLLLLLIGYSLLGGAVFNAIEQPREIEDLHTLHQTLVGKIANFSTQLISTVRTQNETDQQVQVDVESIMKEFYKEMLNLEGRLTNSAFDKIDNNRLVWNFGSAVFYSVAMFTTTGYGTITCASVWGKVLSVIYATIGIPLILVVLNHLGRVALFWLQKLYNQIYRIFRHTRLCRKVDENGAMEHSFPLRIALPLIAIYVLASAVVIYVFDYKLSGEDGSSLSFGDSCYFSFISMTTIGLGDVMPNNIQYSPFVAIMFMFGLVLFSVINSTIYMRMERNYFRAMEAMEEVLDELHVEEMEEENHGHKVFRHLSSAFRIAALTLPEWDEERGKSNPHNLSAILHTPRTSVSSRCSMSPTRRRRHRPSGSSDFTPLTPTLGVLGFNLDALYEINEQNESQLPETNDSTVRLSRAKSRSDTNLSIDRSPRLSLQSIRSLRLFRKVYPEQIRPGPESP